MQMENNNVLIKVLGRVKWFNQFKGYGFVSAEGLPEDIFLHFSVMAQAGIKRLNNDDVILCNVAKSGKGFQVTKIIKVIKMEGKIDCILSNIHNQSQYLPIR